MARRRNERAARVCQWILLKDALATFVRNQEGHQGAEHIKPLHWYVACRLAIEGGFMPDEITPKPQFRVERHGEALLLNFDADAGGGGERAILGGLKTKNVDVVVKEGVGSVVAVSMKGTLGAFRNLTNRMEEMIGDCTNLHLSYPSLVYGFLQVIRATPPADGVAPNDIAIDQNGNVSELIRRYHDIILRLNGRNDVRDAATKYEAVSLLLADPRAGREGDPMPDFPLPDSALHLNHFFNRIYQQYDQRFVYAAPSLKGTTTRLEWDQHSPVLQDPRIGEYDLRLA